VPPPPPANPNPNPNSEDEGGFGDPRHTRKLWRNAAIGLGVTAALLLFGVWLLGQIAEQLVDWVPPEVDVALGEQNWQELAPPEAQCTDPGPLAYVEEIAQPLVDSSDSEFEFQFVVVESEEVNAFALPGGFVTVNMGLLEAAETGEEVAAVIGHEMTHVTARHGTRRVLRQIGGFAVVAMIFGGTDFETIAFAAEGLAQQAYSRDQERESDDGGRALLMAAGIDPIGMATFFERLEQMYAEMPEGMRSSMALVSTHPDPGERAETTREIAAGFDATRDLPPPPDDLRCHAE
jgi:predicted Zn-dependent protease